MEVFDLYDFKKKVLSITFDNPSTNNVAINLFKITLRPPHGGTLFNQKYACYIINLCVQDGMKHFEYYLENIRSALSYIASAGSRIQEFAQHCKRSGVKPRKLPTDVSHRWNSTYLMLKACLPYKEVINVLVFWVSILITLIWKITTICFVTTDLLECVAKLSKIHKTQAGKDQGKLSSLKSY